MKLIGISGSLRAESFNSKLVREAARIFDAESFTFADLRLPLLDVDLEARGIPEPVATLAEQVRTADAVVISTPEYNKALSGVLKNALDWLSRTKPAPLRDKPVAIMSAAAGRAGGERSQWSLRLCLTPFRPRLLYGPEVFVANASDQFDSDGRLTNDRNLAALTELMEALRTEAARDL